MAPELQAAGSITVKAVASETDQGTDTGPAENIGGIVHAQIHAAVTTQCRPRETCQRHAPMAHQKTEECGDGKRVGGMIAWETVKTADIIVDSLNPTHNRRIVRGTQTAHPRLDEGSAQLIGQQDSQSYTKEYQQRLFSLVALEHQPKQRKEEKYPGQRAGDGPHEFVEPHIVVAVDEQKNEFVHAVVLFAD